MQLSIAIIVAFAQSNKMTETNLKVFCNPNNYCKLGKLPQVVIFALKL